MIDLVNNLVSELRVDPQVMQTKAQTVQGKITEMKTAFEEMENLVRKTQNYWLGEGGEAHRELFWKTQEEREELFGRLREDVSDLCTMAAQYSATESEVKQLSEELPADVIV